MSGNKIIRILAASCLLSSAIAFADNSIIPYGNGTWVYDGTYDNAGSKLAPEAGLFIDQLTQYNKSASDSHKITQLFAYGGDIEMYCRGSGGSSKKDACTPNALLLVYYPPSSVSKGNNNWGYWANQLGDRGFSSQQSYLQVPGVNQHIADIDGRVDNTKEDVYDYLDHLNDMSPADAANFADKVAKSICADASVDGVQFDIRVLSKPMLIGQDYPTELVKGALTDEMGINKRIIQ